jgi:hypothetical protein
VTRVRVPGRVVRRGRSVGGAQTNDRASCRRAHRLRDQKSTGVSLEQLTLLAAARAITRELGWNHSLVGSIHNSACCLLDVTFVMVITRDKVSANAPP